jgi:hypothetical protein
MGAKKLESANPVRFATVNAFSDTKVNSVKFRQNLFSLLYYISTTKNQILFHVSSIAYLFSLVPIWMVRLQLQIATLDYVNLGRHNE